MPSGAKACRISGLIMTPNEARMPKASGCCCLKVTAVTRSSLVWAWKMISQCCWRTARVKSAKGPLPKKITWGILIFREEVSVILDFGGVVDGFEVAFVVEAVESVLVVADMINKKNAVEMVDFVH